MKDKKTYYFSPQMERRWLSHAKHEARIFEVEELKESLKNGWKFFPWEVVKKETKEKKLSISDQLKEIYEEDKKEELSPVVIEERDFPGSSNPEVTIVNDSVPATNLVDTISTEELNKCLQRQQPK